MKKVLILPEIMEDLKGGGAYGVAKKTYEADKNKYFDYLFNIKKDKIKKVKKNKIIKKYFLGTRGALYYIKEIVINYFKIKNNINNKYNIIVSHNIIQTLSIIILKYTNKNFMNCKIIYVHHLNGSLYNQVKTFENINNSYILKYSSIILEKIVFKFSNIIGFPSKGALEQYPYKRNLYDKRIEIFYNGINIKYGSGKSLKNNDKIYFSSINTSIKGTGIDRIPIFLKELKDLGINFHWTYIGTGPMGKEIVEKINILGLKNDCTLILKKVEHKKIIEVLNKSHFYVGFHRISIFDFTILEGMSQGCIPILTNTGGNKDFLNFNNGLLVDNNLKASGKTFIKYLNKINYEEISKINISIVKNKFNINNFLNKYKKICEKLSEE